MIRSIRKILHLLYPQFSQNQRSTQQRNIIIREKYNAGEGLSNLARMYKISPQRVYQIITNKESAMHS
jgi:Mor family transcriptional regulator